MDESIHTLVAVVENEVVGYCGLSLPSRDEDAGPDVAEVAAIYVAPERFGTGVGHALMSTALSTLAPPRWNRVTLWMFTANARAQAFYERHGFVLDGATKIDPGTGVEESRLGRELPA